MGNFILFIKKIIKELICTHPNRDDVNTDQCSECFKHLGKKL